MKMIFLLAIGLMALPFLPVCVDIILTIKEHKKAKKKEEEEEKEKQEEEKEKQRIYNKVLNTEWTEKGKPFDIRNIPRLTFDQWLTFYNISPEKWTFKFNQLHDFEYGNCCIFPEFTKGKTDLCTFWETPEDLHQFIKWTQNEYKKGNAAVFENERNKRLSKLTKCLKEEIKQNTAEAQKELAELEKDISEHMPEPKEEDPIQKCLREQKEEPIYGSLAEFINHLCLKYSDYVFVESNRIMLSDGSMNVDVKLIHKHKPGNYIRILGTYDTKTQSWKERQV